MNKTFLDLTERLLEKIEDSWKIYLKVWNLNNKKHVQ